MAWLNSGKRPALTWLLAACVAALVGTLVALNMHDPPADYSGATTRVLRDRIAAHEAEIRRSGTSAAALDADRYWPRDRDRTVLAMFLFREKNKRWPAGWQELRDSDVAPGARHMHPDWQLVLKHGGWEIHLPRHGRIAYFTDPSRTAEHTGTQ